MDVGVHEYARLDRMLNDGEASSRLLAADLEVDTEST